MHRSFTAHQPALGFLFTTLLAAQSTGCIVKTDPASEDTTGTTGSSSNSGLTSTSPTSQTATNSGETQTTSVDSSGQKTGIETTGASGVSSSGSTMPKGEAEDTTTEQEASTSQTETSTSSTTDPEDGSSTQAPESSKFSCDQGFDDIQDPELRAAAIKYGDLQKADLSAIIELKCKASDYEVQSLRGLRCARKLEELDLNGQQLDSLTELSHLKKLTTLGLLGFPVQPSRLLDLGSQLEKLQKLKISIPAKDADPTWINKMKNLESFHLEGPGVSNLHVKKLTQLGNNHKLDHIYLDNTSITDLTPLLEAESKLGTLSFTGFSATVLSQLSRFHLTTRIELRKAEMKDLSWLQAENTLRVLYVSGSPSFRSLAGAQHLHNVSYLYLGDNNISDLTPVQGLKELGTLRLSGNPTLRDLSPLSKMTWLRYLSVRHCSVNDITALAPLRNLTTLKLSYNLKLKDLSPISSNTSLKTLEVSRCDFSDTSQLSGLTRLVNLDISYNLQLSDLAPLRHHYALRDLNASRCDLEDLTPLVELVKSGKSNIETINIKDNPKVCDHASFKELKQLSQTQALPKKVGFTLLTNCG